jgi:hypothetical protein
MATAPTPGIGRRLAAAEDYEDSPLPQVWAIRIDTAEIQVRDFPIDTIQGIARRAGVTWTDVVNAPHSDLRVLRDLMRAACDEFGMKAPALDTAREAVHAGNECLVLVDDDLPKLPYMEGGAADPTNATSMVG